jgi:hypothetical protein
MINNINENGDVIVTIKITSQGEYLVKVQKALLLGIEKIGICETAGNEDHQDAIWILTDLMREFMLDDSQTNVAIGGKPYVDSSRKGKGEKKEA